MSPLSKDEKVFFEKLTHDREESARVLEKSSMRGVKTSVVEKYSEQAHFLYELLQNADDAAAKKVRFVLEENKLLFAHNGRIPFTVSDPETEEVDRNNGRLGHINAITSIGQPGKGANEIGKFGVGFKAVFQYTNTPAIYDPPFAFRIERFIVPSLLESDHPDRKESETLFVFPFDVPDKESTKAFEEIASRLQNLENPLLFLRNLKQIEWKIKPSGTTGAYLKQGPAVANGDIITTIQKVNGVEKKILYLVFNQTIQTSGNSIRESRINLAFEMQPDKKQINAAKKFPAYCFFPTREPTNLKFIIQAPFLLNDSREGIQEGIDWNSSLIKQLANLISDSLPLLRDKDLLNLDFLNVLPLNREDFPENHLFRPIFDRILSVMRGDKPLLPTNDGGHATANLSLLPRIEELTNILDEKQLEQLFGKPGLQWLPHDIPENSPVWNYLNKEVGVQIVRPVEFSSAITTEFLALQTNAWMGQFYTFLGEKSYLWEKGDGSWKQPGPLRAKRFIRLQDGTHVTPFGNDGSPNAYLQHDRDTQIDLPIVKTEICENPAVCEFMKQLGIPDVDVVAVVIKMILPKYSTAAPKITVEEHKNDMELIQRAYLTDSQERKKRLIEKLQVTEFIFTENPVMGISVYKKPTDVYFKTEDLLTYFLDYKNVWFVSSDYSPSANAFFEDLGISRTLRVRRKKSDEHGYVLIENYLGWRHARGLNGFDRDIDVDGLEWALTNPTKERSKFIWNEVVIPHASCIRGVTELSKRLTFENSALTENKVSNFGRLLTNKTWILNQDGILRKPSELSLDELPSSFIHDEGAAKQLGMKCDIVAILANAVGVLGSDLESLRKHLEGFREWVAEIERKYAVPSQLVGDREGRTAKAKNKYRSSANRVYQDRPRSVRTSRDQLDERTILREWYSVEGKIVCQICWCPSSFKNRQEKYYFEAVELIADKKEYEANSLALCPSCAAKYLYGKRTDDNNIKEALRNLSEKWRRKELEEKDLMLSFQLCDEAATMHFVEKHICDLSPLLLE